MYWEYGWEKRGALSPMQGVLLRNEPVLQHRFMNLPKTDDNDRTHKNDPNIHLDIWSMLLCGQVPHTI